MSLAAMKRHGDANMSDTELLTTDEYARASRRSSRTIERERSIGTGCPYVRLGGRILYRRSDIERHIEKNIRGTDVDTAAPQRRGRSRKPAIERPEAIP
jgi:hypothetical protein